MNTEAMNTLKQVREAVNIFQIELNDPTYTDDERNFLGSVLISLNRAEDIIINTMLMEMVDLINSTNNDLKLLIRDMEKSSVRIARFSDTVKKVSNVIGVLAEITAKAISVGIL